ncbi:MAG: alpha/beta hydrolase [Bacteroidota bacterium]
MIKKENYTIAGAGGRLMLADLTFDDANPQAPMVIFAHGFKGFKDWGAYNLMADYFAEQGFRFLKFNFSHNGTTPDQPVDFADLIAFSENTFTMELDDLGRIIDFACNGSAMPRAQSVCLLGHSMGGGISIIKAAEDPRVSKLITMAAIAGFRNLWPQSDEPQWRIQGMRYIINARTGMQMPLKATLLDDLDRNPVRLNIQAKAAEITQPWLLIHGDADTSVPISHAHQLKAAQPAAELLIIKKADHVFNASHPYPLKTLTVELQLLCHEAVQFLRN